MTARLADLRGRRFITRRRASTAALWRSRTTWVGAAPVAHAAWSKPPAPLSVAGSMSDAQLKAAVAAGKEAPIMLQPLRHSQRGAPLTFTDLGACVSSDAARSRLLTSKLRRRCLPARVR
jgi:hypothetical protein